MRPAFVAIMACYGVVALFHLRQYRRRGYALSVMAATTALGPVAWAAREAHVLPLWATHFVVAGALVVGPPYAALCLATMWRERRRR